ncbi:MAG: GspH/FimT family pseudopilin [Gammaproteobacteria bacterium]|nr:GspH/FimT family pseudopilin [Gammaproteobacteria bacterium]
MKASNFQPSFGWSLFEILIVLMLMAILTTLAVPSWYRFWQRHQIKLASRQLASLIHFARELAIVKQQSIQLCASDDGLRCSNAWAQKIIVRSRTKVWRQAQLNVSRLTWRGGLGRQQLQFLATGMSAQLGSFYLSSQHYQCRLRIIYSGRVRLDKCSKIS